MIKNPEVIPMVPTTCHKEPIMQIKDDHHREQKEAKASLRLDLYRQACKKFPSIKNNPEHVA